DHFDYSAVSVCWHCSFLLRFSGHPDRCWHRCHFSGRRYCFHFYFHRRHHWPTYHFFPTTIDQRTYLSPDSVLRFLFRNCHFDFALPDWSSNHLVLPKTLRVLFSQFLFLPPDPCCQSAALTYSCRSSRQ